MQKILKTPLGKAKGLGTAKSGTHHWWKQRLSAVALILLTIWLAALLPSLYHLSSVVDWRNWLSNPYHNICMLLLLNIILYHGYLGLEVVIEDYVPRPLQRFIWRIVLKFLFLGSALMGTVALLHLLNGSGVLQ